MNGFLRSEQQPPRQDSFLGHERLRSARGSLSGSGRAAY